MKPRSTVVLSLALLTLSLFLLSIKNDLIVALTPRFYLSELDTPEYVNKIKNQSGEWNSSFSQPIFLNQITQNPVALTPYPSVLGLVQTQTGEEKWIEIDLTKQTLFAYEGKTKVYEFLISSGKWAPTPTGEFRIWSKFRYSTMIGGDKAAGTYYNLPNVPYVLYFHNGFALHGAYWHNNFGRRMSHGCVNLSVIDAQKLYYWTNPNVTPDKTVFYPTPTDPGTRVIIHD